MQQRRRIYRIAVSGGLLLCCALLLWMNRYELPLLPLYWQTPDKTESHDLDRDGAAEVYRLEGLRLTVGAAEETQTPPEWKVTDFMVGDINRDGAEELLLLVWKQGSFGEHRPFWIEEDDPAYSQHLFIYQWREDKLKPIWMSSALKPQIAAWEWATRADGSLALLLTTPDGEQAEWIWHNWGLERSRTPYTASKPAAPTLAYL